MTTRSPLDASLAAARWIRSVEPAEEADLYRGAAGVVLFLLELHRASSDPAWLAEARRRAEALAESAARVSDPGLYHGLSGVAFALEAAGRGADAAAARARVAAAAPPRAHDVVEGSAGVGLYLLHAGERDAAERLGRRLLEAAIPSRGGLEWECEPGHPVRYPGFAHGTAGVAFFLARLHRATGEPAFLEAARSGARAIEAIADRSGGGFRHFHHEPGGEGLFYRGWCHGPAGTARLFGELARATGEERWRDLVAACARSAREADAEAWENHGACCGDAAVGELLLRAGDRAGAERVAARLLARATPGETPWGAGLMWVHAEHRVHPEWRVPQTGWMQGAAGIGAFFLHLQGFPAIPWPDS